MARQTIRIKPIGTIIGDSSVLLTGDYRDKVTGLNVYILKNKEVVMDRDLTQSEKIFTFAFSRMMPFLDIAYDDAKEKDLLLIKAFSRHPIIKCKGNDNLTNAVFALDNLEDVLNDDTLLIKKKGMVFNYINNTTVVDMINTAFVFGMNPIKMSSQEVFNTLIGKNFDGILMKNPDLYLEKHKNPNLEVITIVHKALLLKVIEKRQGRYYIKDEIIGASVEDIVIYCNKHKNMYEDYIRKEVIKKDLLPIDDKTTVKQATDPTAEQKVKEEENRMSVLLREAKSLKMNMRGLHSMTEENLEKKIAEAKVNLINSETGDKSPSKEEAEKIDNAMEMSAK